MKRSALLLGVLLAGCAPALFSGSPVVSATAPADPSAATLSASWSAEQSRVTFGAGTEAALGYTLKIDGVGVRVNAPQVCRVVDLSVLCTVPTLPAGGNFILPMRGSNLSAVATYKRASGQQFSLRVSQ